MKVKQIYEIINSITQETLGSEVILKEDLSNIVDVGAQLITEIGGYDNYVHSLIDKIGMTVFVNRVYQGGAPSVLMDAWEYGSIVEKVTMSLPNAEENESWELKNGEVYEENIFYKPEISVKYFNDKVTFDVAISLTERQVKESLQSETQLNAFVSMIYNAIEKTMTVKTDALIMRTINNFIGETVADEYEDANYTEKSGVRAVNLLKLYNDKNPENTLTKEEAITNGDFIKFASYTMGLYVSRLEKISTLFNIGGTDKFTTRDFLKVVMLADFRRAADSYLQADTFHNEFTKLPGADTVAYWQGSGKDYSFASTSKINLKTASGKDVELDGILAVMFDRDALGVTNFNRRTTSKYNAKAEFYNNWFKMDAGYFNDTNENFVVFFVQ